MKKIKILDSQQIDQKLNRMAYQVYETNFKEKELLIVGIEGNGYKVAQRIVTILESISITDEPQPTDHVQQSHSIYPSPDKYIPQPTNPKPES